MEGDSAAFVSPTGNIACVVISDSATCQVLDRTYTPEYLASTQIGPCELSEADTIYLVDERGAWTCAAEPLVPSAAVDRAGWWEAEVEGDTVEVDGVRVAVLPYGETLTLGATSCTSSEEGMSCTNSEIGREFFVSRTSYRHT